jgi:chorismate dehydratase
MLRIGRIAYANCIPIFHTLLEQYPGADYRYIEGVPARLNAQLASGDIDVCPSSSIAYALNPDRYLIIPDLSISSCGPVQSVLLFSVVPIEELDGRDVLLTAESATSVNLLKILLSQRYGCHCSFRVTDQSIDAALREAPAVLLIGDAALRALYGLQAASEVQVYDLGGLWYDWTGTPFVFALWLASRKAFALHPDELRTLAGQLQQAKAYGLANLGRIADASPDADWMGRDRLLEYWRRNLSYDLGREHQEGLKRFFRLAADMRLIEQAPELAFLE